MLTPNLVLPRRFAISPHTCKALELAVALRIVSWLAQRRIERTGRCPRLRVCRRFLASLPRPEIAPIQLAVPLSPRELDVLALVADGRGTN